MILYSSVHQILAFLTSVFHIFKAAFASHNHTGLQFFLVIYVIVYLLKTRIDRFY